MNKKVFWVLALFCVLLPSASAFVSNTSDLTISIMQTTGGLISNNSKFVIYTDSSPQSFITNTSKLKLYVSFITGKKQIEAVIIPPVPPSGGGGGGGVGITSNFTDCYGGQNLFIDGFDYCNYCSNGVIYLTLNSSYACYACRSGLHYSVEYNRCVEEGFLNKIIVNEVWFKNEFAEIGVKNVSENFSVSAKTYGDTFLFFNASNSRKFNNSYVFSFLVNFSEGVYSVQLVDESYVETKSVDVILGKPLTVFVDCSKKTFLINGTDLCLVCVNGTLSYNSGTGERFCYTCPSGLYFNTDLKTCVVIPSTVYSVNGFVNLIDSKADWLGYGNRLLGYAVMLLIVFLAGLVIYFVFKKKT